MEITFDRTEDVTDPKAVQNIGGRKLRILRTKEVLSKVEEAQLVSEGWKLIVRNCKTTEGTFAHSLVRD